jgi:ABC-type multidrug transport system permease subunit
MTVLTFFRWVASCLVSALLAALLILVATPSFASLTVEDPEDESPGGHEPPRV